MWQLRLPSVLLALALVAAGCGGRTAGDSALSVFAKAEQQVSEERTFRFSVQSSTTMGSRVTEGVIEGVIDYAAGTLRMTVTDNRGARGEMVFPGDGYLYNRSNGARWTRRPAPRAVSSFDPREGIAALGRHTGEVEDLGDDEVKGERMRHYRAALKGDRPGQRLPVEVWLDSEGRLRRMKHSYDIGGPSGTARFSGRSTTDLFAFGTPVKVSPPPAAEVDEEPEGGRRPPKIEPVPPWRDVLGAEVDGVAFRVDVAAGTSSARCIRVRTTPDIGGDGIRRQDNAESSAGGSEGPAIGCEARSAGTENAVSVLATNLNSSGQEHDDIHYVAGVAVAEIKGLTATFADGATRDTQLVDGAFIVVWRGTNAWRSLTATRADGEHLICEDEFEKGGHDITCRLDI